MDQNHTRMMKTGSKLDQFNFCCTCRVAFKKNRIKCELSCGILIKEGIILVFLETECYYKHMHCILKSIIWQRKGLGLLEYFLWNTFCESAAKNSQSNLAKPICTVFLQRKRNEQNVVRAKTRRYCRAPPSILLICLGLHWFH